jgi:hypothetical protein
LAEFNDFDFAPQSPTVAVGRLSQIQGRNPATPSRARVAEDGANQQNMDEILTPSARAARLLQQHSLDNVFTPQRLSLTNIARKTPSSSSRQLSTSPSLRRARLPSEARKMSPGALFSLQRQEQLEAKLAEEAMREESAREAAKIAQARWDKWHEVQENEDDSEEEDSILDNSLLATM